MMKTVRWLVNGISNVLITIVLVCLLFMAVCGLSKWTPYIVLSGSMEPSIRTGSLCVVDTGYPFGQVQTGDVIAFETGTGQLVTHRVVSALDGYLETKGDANQVSDGFTTDEGNYRGRTIFSIPWLGYAVDFLQTARGKIISTSVVAAWFLFGWLLDECGRRRKALAQLEEGECYGRDKK